jgi:hypothetical protein
MGLFNAFRRNTARVVSKVGKAVTKDGSKLREDFEFLAKMVKEEDAEIANRKKKRRGR